MAYQVLARKWRPQDLASVVGQEPVVTALRNAIADGRVAPALLPMYTDERIRERQLTTADLSGELPDVPPATLYRHLSVLAL